MDISTNRAVFDINVPVGTTAKILIPGGNAADITAGGNRISTEMQESTRFTGKMEKSPLRPVRAPTNLRQRLYRTSWKRLNCKRDPSGRGIK